MNKLTPYHKSLIILHNLSVYVEKSRDLFREDIGQYFEGKDPTEQILWHLERTQETVEKLVGPSIRRMAKNPCSTGPMGAEDESTG